MTTDQPPLDDLDLSAVLDHEADDDVAARLEADPSARARLEQMRAARAALQGAVVADLPPDQVDTLVTAALAVADEAGPNDDHHVDTAADDDRGAIVAPLPPTRRNRVVPQWAVAAVVVVLVGLGLTLVWTGRDNGDDDLALSTIGMSIVADDQSDEAERGSDAALSAEAEAGAEDSTESGAAGTGESQLEGEATTTAPGASAGPTLVNLGEFVDADALRLHLRDAFPTESAEPLPDTGIDDDLTAAFRCLGKVEGMFEPLGDPTSVGIALVAGEAAVVYEMPFRTDDGRDTALVIAVNEVTCIPVLAFQR